MSLEDVAGAVDDEQGAPLSDRMTQAEVGIAMALATSALAQGGPAGLGFLFEPVPTPLWFTLSAFVLPTGELLAWLRSLIPQRRGSSSDRE